MAEGYDLDGHNPEESICSWRLECGIQKGDKTGEFMQKVANRDVRNIVCDDTSEIDLGKISVTQVYEKRYGFRGIIRGLRPFFE